MESEALVESQRLLTATVLCPVENFVEVISK